jgi:hypothetical protein
VAVLPGKGFGGVTMIFVMPDTANRLIGSNTAAINIAAIIFFLISPLLIRRYI